jgi:hypothetical protein
MAIASNRQPKMASARLPGPGGSIANATQAVTASQAATTMLKIRPITPLASLTRPPHGVRGVQLD